MLRKVGRKSRLALLAAGLALIGACAANPLKMAPEMAVAANPYDAGATVQVSGAKEYIVKNASIQEAVETAIQTTGLFPKTSAPGYTIRLDVLSIENPLAGADLKSKVRINWSLRSQGSPDPIWKDQIATEATAGFTENLIAVQRMAMANERAISENIRVGLSEISKFAPSTITSDQIQEVGS